MNKIAATQTQRP